MRVACLIIVSLCVLSPAVFADVAQDKSKYDLIRIGHIPPRYAFFKGEPMTTLESKSSNRHDNLEMKALFTALKALNDKGIRDNATEFHQNTVTLTAVYKGEMVHLLYSGDSNLEKFRAYEKDWKALHQKFFQYLTRKIAPQ